MQSNNAVEQSHAITEMNEIARKAGLPLYSYLVIATEQAQLFPGLRPQSGATPKTFAEQIFEYVNKMLREERTK